MFGLNRLFKRRPIIVMVPAQGLSDLASRVHERMRGVRTDTPLLTMLEIAAEESRFDVDIAHFRQMAVLREDVYSLPPRQRATLYDHFEGLTYKQIAKRRGVTERIALRDLTRAFATLRMKDYERSNGESGHVQGAAGAAIAGVRDSAPDVGISGGVHCAGAPGGGLSGSPVQQRPDAGGEESGPRESTQAP